MIVKTLNFRVIIDFPIGRGWPRFVEDAVRDMAIQWESCVEDERTADPSLSAPISTIFQFVADSGVFPRRGTVHNPFVAVIQGWNDHIEPHAVTRIAERLQARIHHDDVFYSKVHDRKVHCQVQFWDSNLSAFDVKMKL